MQDTLRAVGTEFVERYHPVNPAAPRIDVRWRVVGHIRRNVMVEVLEAVAVMMVPNLSRPPHYPSEYKGET